MQKLACCISKQGEIFTVCQLGENELYQSNKIVLMYFVTPYSSYQNFDALQEVKPLLRGTMSTIKGWISFEDRQLSQGISHKIFLLSLDVQCAATVKFLFVKNLFCNFWENHLLLRNIFPKIWIRTEKYSALV